MYLEHANINVKSIDECVRFLTAACPDFEIRHQGIDDGTPWAHVGTDATYIALNETPEMGFPAEPLNHLGFVVDDADALAARLQAAGFREGFITPAHAHRKRRYFFDADGLEWEFVEYLSDDPAEYNGYEK
jgi:catechol 2,3-dioxygenase-like lactoylglutathione lyase family enzyme